MEIKYYEVSILEEPGIRGRAIAGGVRWNGGEPCPAGYSPCDFGQVPQLPELYLCDKDSISPSFSVSVLLRGSSEVVNSDLL